MVEYYRPWWHHYDEASTQKRQEIELSCQRAGSGYDIKSLESIFGEHPNHDRGFRPLEKKEWRDSIFVTLWNQLSSCTFHDLRNEIDLVLLKEMKEFGSYWSVENAIDSITDDSNNNK